MSILAVIQARMNSSRLPGKVLKPVLGRTLLELQMERVLESRRITQVVVATSTEPADNAIEALCIKNGWICFRGHLTDVLDRFYQVAKVYPAETLVRLTADCPLIDPEIIDQVIEFYYAQGVDYASNSFEPTFPDGLDVEVIRSESLVAAWRDSVLPSNREHVTQYLIQNPQLFKLASFRHSEDLSQFRWTVDEPADFDLIKAVYEGIYPKNPHFRMADVLNFLNKNPEISRINQNFVRNEGLEKSLKQDLEYQSQQQKKQEQL